MATFQQALGKTFQALPQMLQMYQQAYYQSQNLKLEERKTTATEKESASAVQYYDTQDEKTQAELKHFKDMAPIELQTAKAAADTADLNKMIAKAEWQDLPYKTEEAHQSFLKAQESLQAQIDASKSSVLTDEQTRRFADYQHQLDVIDVNLKAIEYLKTFTDPRYVDMGVAMFNNPQSPTYQDLTGTTQRIVNEGLDASPETKAALLAASQTFGNVYAGIYTNVDDRADAIAQNFNTDKNYKFTILDENGKPKTITDAGEWAMYQEQWKAQEKSRTPTYGEYQTNMLYRPQTQQTQQSGIKTSPNKPAQNPYPELTKAVTGTFNDFVSSWNAYNPIYGYGGILPSIEQGASLYNRTIRKE